MYVTAIQVWQGAIAASAPIWTYLGQTPPMDPVFYAKGVTYDTTEAAGAAPGCTGTLRNAWAAIISQAETGSNGLNTVSESMRICPVAAINSTGDAYRLRDWAGDAFDMMAMGNYPFPSSYMLNGHGELPAFPMRVACSALMDAVGQVRYQCVGDLVS
jgi:lysosomal Pro-X carboxypeptidase